MAINALREAEKGDGDNKIWPCFVSVGKGVARGWENSGKGAGPPPYPLSKQISYHSGSSLLANQVHSSFVLSSRQVQGRDSARATPDCPPAFCTYRSFPSLDWWGTDPFSSATEGPTRATRQSCQWSFPKHCKLVFQGAHHCLRIERKYDEISLVYFVWG